MSKTTTARDARVPTASRGLGALRERVMDVMCCRDREVTLTEVVDSLILRYKAVDRSARMFSKQLEIVNEAFDTKNRVHEALNRDYLKVRARVEARTRVAIESSVEDGELVYQCNACGVSAESPEALRHIAGTRIGERACEYLLDARALGLQVLDDSEEPQ